MFLLVSIAQFAGGIKKSDYWNSFSGSQTYSEGEGTNKITTHTSWGPSPGWILTLVAMVMSVLPFLLILYNIAKTGMDDTTAYSGAEHYYGAI